MPRAAPPAPQDGSWARGARAVAAVGVLVGLAVAPSADAATLGTRARSGPPPALELVAQTAVVPPGGTFSMLLGTPGIPADASVTVEVHQRVRSRSELALSMEGDELRNLAFGTAKSLSDLPVQPDGTRRLDLSLDPADGVTLSAEGVYPV